MPFVPTTIPELTAASSVAGTDTLVVETSAGTRKATVNQLVGQGVSGLVYADLSAAAADNLAALQALDVAGNRVVCIFEPGTYTLSMWASWTYIQEVRHGPGVTMKLKAGAAQGDSIYRPNKAGVRITGCGKYSVLDANKAAQSHTSNLRCVFSDGYADVTVEGLRITGATGRGAYLTNASDLWIRDCDYDNCGGYGENEALYVSRYSVGTSYRNGIVNCRGTGFVAVEMVVSGGVLVSPLISSINGIVTAADPHILSFTSGGAATPVVGETITGETSGATGTLSAIALLSGSWSGGDAAGILTFVDQTGAFEAEDLTIGGVTGIATIALPSGAAEPAVELWSLEQAGNLRPMIFNAQVFGDNSGIGVSLARATGGIETLLQAYNFVLPLELADSTYSQLTSSYGDCNGAPSSTAASLININDDGYHNKAANLTLRGFKYVAAGGGGKGMQVRGSTVKPYNTVVENVTCESTYDGVNGFDIEAAPGTELKNPQARVTGAASYPITFYSGSDNSRSEGGMTHMGAGATAGVHVRILDSDNVHCSPLPHMTHASGTLAQALAITNSDGSKMLGGAILGTVTIALLMTADGSGETIANCEVGGWSGTGGNIGCDTDNSGTIGAGNIVRRSPGFDPYGSTDAELEEFHGQIDGSGYSTSRWLRAKTTSSPNTIATTGIPGLIGSEILDTTNAIKYVNTTGASDGWSSFDVT